MEKENFLNEITALCKKKQSFNDLAENLGGLDPLLIKDYIKELEKLKKIKPFEDGWVTYNFKKPKVNQVTDSRTFQNASISISKFLFNNKPHPLDYEWRNSPKTLDFLYEMITACNGANDHVLLLGMPGLFMRAYEKNFSLKVTLVDNNAFLINSIKNKLPKTTSFNIIQSDVFTSAPSEIGSYQTVFIDPPWYSQHFFGFIWLAAQCLEINGYLAMSLPQLNTRPGMREERESWFRHCEKMGLKLERLENSKMEYIMPFFEFNAFRAGGIKGLQPFWRKGDLAIFRKTSKKYVKRPSIKPLENNWDEIEIKGVRFRVRRKANQTIPFSIHHILPGDILPSVSSRHPKRQIACIWTSGNRIFDTSDSALFLEYAKKYSTSELIPTVDFSVTQEYLDYIIDIETKEYENYLDWLNYELERRNYKWNN